MNEKSNIGQLQIVKKNKGSIWSIVGWCQIDEKTHEPIYGKGTKYIDPKDTVEPPFETTGFVAVPSKTPVGASTYLLRNDNIALTMAKSISLVHQMPKDLTHLILYTRSKSEQDNASVAPYTSEDFVKEYIANCSPVVVYDVLGIANDTSKIPVEWFSNDDKDKLGYNGPVTDELIHDVTFERMGQIAGGAAMALFGRADWDMGNYGEVMWTTGWGRKHARMILEAISLGKVALPEGLGQFSFPYASFDQQRLMHYGTCLDGIEIPNIVEEDILYKIMLVWSRLSENKGDKLLDCRLSDDDAPDLIPQLVADYAKENGIDHMIDAVLAGVPPEDTTA